jgi:hypothetical protein
MNIREKRTAINRQIVRTGERDRAQCVSCSRNEKEHAVIQTAQRTTELQNMIELNASHLLRISAPAIRAVLE